MTEVAEPADSFACVLAVFYSGISCARRRYGATVSWLWAQLDWRANADDYVWPSRHVSSFA